MPIAIGVLVCQWQHRAYADCYRYRRGVLRCSFRQGGTFSGASERGASDSAGLHAFFVSVGMVVVI